ncbi:hypothetical protein [Streptomyces humi]|uniref:hypothetical protein n=1 Tax=Streptomyces humi TaxID=1428620 RepID=UPI000628975B|nr:hypothetical protein [Streptomyces humi]
MTTEEFTHPPTEEEARAAFVSRAAGAAADAGELVARAAALLPYPVAGGGGTGDRTGGRDEEDVTALLAALAAHLTGPARPGGVPGRSAVWGLDLDTGTLRRVPAGRLAGPSGPAQVGVAAGLTWVGALEAGMTAHCEALLARRLTEPGTRVPRLCLTGRCDGRCSVDGCGTGATGATRSLYTAGEPVAHDLSALLSLPACAIRVAPRPGTVLATGATRTEAVRRATARALRSLTAPEGGGPRTLPPLGPDRELRPAGPVPPAPVHWSRPLDALRAQGLTPVAVLPDQDPHVHEVLPYLVQVVLLDGPRP